MKWQSDPDFPDFPDFRDDPVLLSLLGICPLLSAVVSLLAGVSLGVAALAMFCAVSTRVLAVRRWLPAPARLPATLVLMAALATAINVLFQAFFFDAWLALGVALPLLMTNAAVLARAETLASRQAVPGIIKDAASTGARLVLLLAALGALRELLGRGTLLAGADAFGERVGAVTVHLLRGDSGFEFALAPAAGFLIVGLLVGARNAVAMRRAPAATVP